MVRVLFFILEEGRGESFSYKQDLQRSGWKLTGMAFSFDAP